MDYVRKKRWVKYQHIKCKLYLRNDFRFECAYCRMREQDTGALLEDAFEKDHFIAKASPETDIDVDRYDNMVYACAKCNGTKSDKNVELLLDPCKDNIYSGKNPHVIKLGKKDHYLLAGKTPEGKQFIDSLQLNARYYREMREKQEQSDKDNEEIKQVLDVLSDNANIPEDLLHRLSAIVQGDYLIQANNQKNIAFRCGRSKAGEAFQKVLKILDRLSISYDLLFGENDIDIRIQYSAKEYLCEIILNDKAEKAVSHIRPVKEKIESWTSKAGNYGILYYYIRTERLDFYCIGSEKMSRACLSNSSAQKR